MRILVTGNLGYVGPSVVRTLRASRPDAVLVGLDTGYFSHLAVLHPDPRSRVDIQFYADVRHPPVEALAGIDCVIHLAAISNDPIGEAFGEVTYEVNQHATAALARLAKQEGARSFVFSSSCSIYGSAGEEARNESSPVDPLTAYARSKVAAERELADLAGADFQVTCLRFATACGMSDCLRLDLVLNDFVASALVNGRILVLSDGSPWRPLIHVGDMARAIDWAVDRQAGEDHLVVNAGSDAWNYRIGDLAAAVAGVLPGIEVEISATAQPDRRSYRVDFARFGSLAPDHQPVVWLQQAVEELAEGLQSIGFDCADFRRSSWMRLQALTELREAGILTGRLTWA